MDTTRDLNQIVFDMENITSELIPSPPRRRQSEDPYYPLSIKDLDEFITILTSRDSEISEEMNKSIYNIYTKLRDSAFIDNYLYLYFDFVFPSCVQGIITSFNMNTVLYDLIDSKEERVEFLEKMKKRVIFIQFIRDISGKFKDVTIDDSARYDDILVLNKRMMSSIELDILYAERGEGDHDTYIYPGGQLIPKFIGEGIGSGWDREDIIENWSCVNSTTTSPNTGFFQTWSDSRNF